MSIYRELLEISKDKSLKSELDDISEFIYKNYDTKINFCEIFGNRWSYFAGVNELLIPEYRIILTKNLGIFAENVNEKKWDEILTAIKKIIK